MLLDLEKKIFAGRRNVDCEEGNRMEQCIQEHHGYFSLDMNYSFECSFQNKECRGSRFCFVYVECGKVRYKWNNIEEKCNGPAGFCIHEGEEFEIENKEGIHIIIFHPHIINSGFDFENIRNSQNTFSITEVQDAYLLSSFLKERDAGKESFVPDKFLGQRIEQLINKYRREILLQDSDFWACKSRSCLMEILSLVADESDEKNSDLEEEQLVEDMKSFLVSNLEQKITISDLTRQFHMNRTDLSKLFLEKTGTTIMNYVFNKRMELAAAFLRNTGLPGTVIMERVGFNQYAYFSRCFKKYTGISPREYRQSYRK